ncbi:hypothetical protein BHE74_00009241 [Ensete ventricosum]|nr:hypothetical protein BHE74_00009241 [Ensete ventricosum]
MPQAIQVLTKVCNFILYRPVRAVHTGPPGYRYTDRPLPGGSVKNRPSAIDFGRRWPIKEEIERRRSIKEEKGKKKRKRKRKEEGKKEYLARAPSSPPYRHRPRVTRGRSHFFSCVRRRSISPRREKDRGDVVHTGPSGYRYTDRPLPDSTTKNRPPAIDFGHQRSISAVSGQFREKLTVDGRLRENGPSTVD